MQSLNLRMATLKDKYKIAIITDEDSWINPYAEQLVDAVNELGHDISWKHDFDSDTRYDMVFLLSYSKIILANGLKLNKHNLVVHESALPQGRGWSPLSWQILEGKTHFPITLFEAAEHVDAGQIYLQKEMIFTGTELVEDLRKIQGQSTVEICLEFISKYPAIIALARKQQGTESFYPRRTPKDSKLDVSKTIAEQFDLLRIVDNQKYPAWFEYRGKKYKVQIDYFDR